MQRALVFRTRVVRALLMAALGAGVAACDDAGPVAPTEPTATTVTVTTTFTGVLNKNGAATFPFAVLGSGSAAVTLLQVDPDPTIALGLSLGTWNGSSCTAVISNDNALELTTITGTIGSAGNLCVRIYDTGRIGTSVTYAISVSHP